jgi:hypothetical protein
MKFWLKIIILIKNLKFKLIKIFNKIFKIQLFNKLKLIINKKKF